MGCCIGSETDQPRSLQHCLRSWLPDQTCACAEPALPLKDPQSVCQQACAESQPAAHLPFAWPATGPPALALFGLARPPSDAQACLLSA